MGKKLSLGPVVWWKRMFLERGPVASEQRLRHKRLIVRGEKFPTMNRFLLVVSTPFKLSRNERATSHEREDPPPVEVHRSGWLKRVTG